jgi:hypothetical protein
MTGNDGINGTFESAAIQRPTAAQILYPNVYLGDIPVTYSVETSELGNAAVGEPSGYTTEKLAQFHQQQGGTHIFWNRRNFVQANGSYQHLWDNQVNPGANANADEFDLPYIRANPWPAANKVFPSSY